MTCAQAIRFFVVAVIVGVAVERSIYWEPIVRRGWWWETLAIAIKWLIIAAVLYLVEWTIKKRHSKRAQADVSVSKRES